LTNLPKVQVTEVNTISQEEYRTYSQLGLLAM